MANAQSEAAAHACDVVTDSAFKIARARDHGMPIGIVIFSMGQQGCDESDRSFALMKMLAEGIYDEGNNYPGTGAPKSETELSRWR